jgi:hypothetical protein
MYFFINVADFFSFPFIIHLCPFPVLLLLILSATASGIPFIHLIHGLLLFLHPGDISSGTCLGSLLPAIL